MDIRRGCAAINGAEIYYELAGGGPCLVFIHGFSLDTRAWDAQFSVLANDFQVLRYDLRGFGRSTLPDAHGYSHTDDLSALLAFLNIERAVVVGLSMGGWIATHFTLEHPALTRALVLVDAALLGSEWSSEWKQQWGEVKTCAKQIGIAAAKQRWLRHSLFAGARTQPVLFNRLSQMVDDYSGWHWLHGDPLNPIDPPDRERLHEISVPTLVVLGETDIEDFQIIAAIFRRTIAQIDDVVLPGVGHLANMEAPQAFNRALRKFLAANEIG